MQRELEHGARTPVETNVAPLGRVGAMGNSPTLLILNRQQFGYHTDTYFYCKHLRGSFRITYLCWDYGKPRFEIDGVTVKYVSRIGPKWRRYLRFVTAAISESRKAVDLVFIKYFPGAAALRLLARRRRYILDIRTRAVVGNPATLAALNALLRTEALCFRHITVISDSLARSLSLPQERIHVIPLGAEPMPTAPRRFDRMRLLYVGTLAGRRIHETVLGLAGFLKLHGERAKCEYVIVGSGFRQEEQQLRDLVSGLGLDDIVRVVGFVPRDALRPFFEQQNIGVAYIPMTKYFDTQPPTKLFEYLLAGLPVIATRTSENQRIVTEENGILVGDTADEFRDGLVRMHQKLPQFSSERIHHSAERYSWSRIVEQDLIPYLEALLRDEQRRELSV